MTQVEEMVERLPALARGFAYACLLDGSQRHSPVYGRPLLSFFCNCLDCCGRRVLVYDYPAEYMGMIAVRVRTAKGANRG